MRHSILIAALLIIAIGCKTEKSYITNNTGPADWQGPVLDWRTDLDAEVRGTVGLDVNVTDSSGISRVSFYLDGQTRQTLTTPPWRFEIVTDSLLDGVHWCEARAFDQYGNLGISPTLRMNVMNSMAEGPRLLWVPDSFATIQAAINAATDFDTIRVRDGIYYETLNLFGKGIWLESEHGPMRCTVDGHESNTSILCPPNRFAATVRGFNISGASYGFGLIDGCTMGIFNNWIRMDSLAEGLLITGSCGGDFRNNLFLGSRYGVQLGYVWGNFQNNIIENVVHVALWNAATLFNPVIHEYNIYWNNGEDFNDRFAPSQGELFQNPLFSVENGNLLPSSPCVDNGDPDLNDVDGTRSDIGPTGGPHAYIIQGRMPE